MSASRAGLGRSVAVAAALAAVISAAGRADAPPPGRAVYERWCAPCHDPGLKHAGTQALTAKYQGVKSGVLLEWNDLPAANVRHFVRHGVSSMPPFRKTEISDAELDALAAYLSRNSSDH